MAYYITRTQTMTQAVNTYVAMTLDSEGATVVAPVVPKGVKKIVAIIVSIAASIVAVASSGVTITLKLSGTGVVSEQAITIGAVREDTTSTGGFKQQGPQTIETDIDVLENTINMALAMNGVDPGSPQATVTLVLA